MSRFREKILGAGPLSIVSSLISIVIGLLFGCALLFILKPAAAPHGIVSMLTAGFSAPEKFAKVLYQAAPLIMTGLSVGFAFKTGLFNIGASGQYTVGACLALICGIVLKMPWWAGLIASMIGGAVWGAFPGVLKAYFNVNEVITSIMFNWIGLFAVNLVLSNIPSVLANYYGAANADRTAALAAANKSAIIPNLGLDKVLNSNYMNISVFLAAILAIVMYIILNKTVFGYELKACGHNRNASIYAGINARRNIVLSMIISGALSGIAGGLYYLAGTGQYTIDKNLLQMGFNGIPVALLATSNPVGTIFTGMFISYIQVGGDAMQPEFAVENITVIVSVIIYLSAFALLMRNVISRPLLRRSGLKTAEEHEDDGRPSGGGLLPKSDSEGEVTGQ
ncbi:nucleoside ABC transporter membrane protein [Sporobacter termitidis DSM 10068]|uniref:Nucleoside ABC transporter membrane protein n=1 Tax=Sporobacter termitidis DSM 10068 TaxID=1123282 RepID=A0A1M5XQL6_9FIRM|nr:ABC transporter permease [Sporobacter termitidis]SHI02046.1 nucleoside ABC transporter membrane protein [Sporobacter termitidis DSM 10068]